MRSLQLLITTCFSAFTLVSSAQMIGDPGAMKPPVGLPPSPQAAALGRYGEVPVNHNTGLAEVSIPLFQLGLKEFSLPVSLSYHSLGNRVDDVASNPGLGWVLNAGGAISTTVKDADDFIFPPLEIGTDWYLSLLQTYPAWDAPSWAQCNYINYPPPVYEEASRYAEGAGFNIQREVYNYNFAGFSGQFIPGPVISAPADAEYIYVNTGHPIPYKPLKIFFVRRAAAPAHTFLLIIDESGNKYEFDRLEVSGMTQTCIRDYNYLLPGGNYSYFLSKIITPFGEWIDFQYTREDYETPYMKTQQRSVAKNSNCSGCPGEQWFDECISTLHVQGERLTSISSSNGVEITLQYGTDRKDLPGTKKLEGLAVAYNSNGISVPKKQITFANSYFGLASDASGPINPLSTKLKLDGVTVSNGSESLSYSFEYYPGIATRLSTSQDIYGYSRPASTLLPIMPDFPNGANRAPDILYASEGALRKLIYPAKGWTEFVYELQGNGGLRIKSIADYSFDGIESGFRTYSYGYGDSGSDPSEGGGGSFTKPYEFFVPGACGPDLDPSNLCQYTTINSSAAPNFYFSPTGNKYAYVEEVFGRPGLINGRNTYKYTTSLDIDIAASSLLKTPNTQVYISFLSGLLKEKSAWKSTGNPSSPWELVKTTQYEYEVSGENEYGVKGAQITLNTPQHSYYIGMDGYCKPASFEFRSYMYVSSWCRTRRVKEFEYMVPGMPPLQTETNFLDYDPITLQARTVTSTGSKGEQITDTYTFASSYDNTVSGGIYDLMVKRNYLTPIVEHYRSIDGKAISAELNSYAAFVNYFKVANTYTLSSAVPVSNFIPTADPANPDLLRYRKKMQILNYDQQGNVLEFKEEKNITSAYLWGYKHTYLVAEVKNATYQQVAGILGQGVIDQLNNNPGSDAEVRSLLAPLLTHPDLKNCPVSIVTYDPLVGITSVTDANNLTSYYEYDGLSRLRVVKDSDGKIIKRIRYHFKE